MSKQIYILTDRKDIEHIVLMHASVRSTDNTGPNTNERKIRHKMLVYVDIQY